MFSELNYTLHGDESDFVKAHLANKGPEGWAVSRFSKSKTIHIRESRPIRWTRFLERYDLLGLGEAMVRVRSWLLDWVVIYVIKGHVPVTL
ncbi:hypothetical protein LIER_40608 [Lithospermum erythrorhizon]|uniref:Uncharacterized protein n=1 Tax=Lithospermum erythrorhizon TaxID=34254 RepID=A0AAV3QWZ5_LITER